MKPANSKKNITNVRDAITIIVLLVLIGFAITAIINVKPINKSTIVVSDIIKTSQEAVTEQVSMQK